MVDSFDSIELLFSFLSKKAKKYFTRVVLITIIISGYFFPQFYRDSLNALMFAYTSSIAQKMQPIGEGMARSIKENSQK